MIDPMDPGGTWHGENAPDATDEAMYVEFTAWWDKQPTAYHHGARGTREDAFTAYWGGRAVDQARLQAAERVCLLFGWGGDFPDSERGQACVQAWREWHNLVGSNFAGPKAHPELNDEAIAALAREYQERRQATLAAYGLTETDQNGKTP